MDTEPQEMTSVKGVFKGGEIRASLPRLFYGL